MIERHDYLPAATGDTVIWHYMSVSNFMYLLNRHLLYFSRVDHLEDKAEVLVSEVEKNYWRKILNNDLEPWIHRERTRVFINCWIKSNFEISTMWSAYASQGTGVAIKTTVDRLINSYQGDKHISILDVEYIDHKSQIVQPSGAPINALRFFSTKRLFYEVEHELRLIYESLKPAELDSFQIPIDINTLVEELRVGPNASSDLLEMIKTVVPAKGGIFQVTESELRYT